MATGEDGGHSDYRALRDVRDELVTKLVESEADENVLIAKARDRKIIQSIQASAAVGPGPQSRKEKAEQLVNQVLGAVRTDATKAEEFLKLLQEISLGHITDYLRGKLSEYAARRGAGDDGHDQPKLEHAAVSTTDDSAFAEDRTAALQDGEDEPEHQDTVQQHRLATADGSEGTTTPFKPLSSSVVVVEQEHGNNLVVSTDDISPSVADTQPHSDGPLAVTAGGSSVPVLPETKRMQQENLELQAQLAEKTNKEEQLTHELVAMSLEKEKSEEILKEKEKELEEKETQIKEMKAEMQRLQQELKEERENNIAQKKMLEEKIKDLERQLKEKEDSYAKEKLELVEQKHELQLQIEKMRTSEEKLKRQISEEKCKAAELLIKEKERDQRDTIDELKKQHEQQVSSIRREHRNSVVEMEKEITTLRKKKGTLEPDTS